MFSVCKEFVTPEIQSHKREEGLKGGILFSYLYSMLFDFDKYLK